MSAIDALRENLREAARRDIDARRVRRRRQRRFTGALAAVLVGGAAVAGAADLISEGAPAPDTRAMSETYKPPPGSVRPTILATADVGDALPLAVGAYDSAKGQRCLVVGSMNAGYVLGLLENGKFRPFQRQAGVCAAPEKSNWDRWHYRGNTLVVGRAAADKPKVTVTVDGESKPATLYKDRAFLLVYKGDVPLTRIRVAFSR